MNFNKAVCKKESFCHVVFNNLKNFLRQFFTRDIGLRSKLQRCLLQDCDETGNLKAVLDFSGGSEMWKAVRPGCSLNMPIWKGEQIL